MNAAWQEVRCADCGASYTCTPFSDYYHRPDIPEDERALTNGVCEPCLLGGLRTVVVDPARQS